MHPDLDQVLRERYPQIFAGPLCLCIDYPGWFQLLDVLCERLQHETDHHGAPQLVAGAPKGKFGGLRFDWRGGDSAAQLTLIEFAELLSERTCEICGRAVDPNPNGMGRTRCDAHPAERHP